MTYAVVQKFPRYPAQMPVVLATHAGTRVQTLTLENVSLGGAFVRTTQPVSAGSEVTLRFGDLGNVVGGTARVVHVIKDTDSPIKLHPPGMGLEFRPLDGSAHAALLRLVEDLAARAPVTPSFRVEPRIPTDVKVRVHIPGREALAELAATNLSKGGLFVETPDPPPKGTRVTVQLATPAGLLMLHAEVVHRVDVRLAEATRQKPGAGLQFVDYDVAKRRELARYLTGNSQTITDVPVLAPLPTSKLNEMLNAARRLLEGVERQDPFGAIGLDRSASEVMVQVRLGTLHELFALEPVGAAPAQAARVQSAARVLHRVEQNLLGIMHERRRPKTVAQQSGLDDEAAKRVAQAINRAAKLQDRGHYREARVVLLSALEQAPEHPGLKARVQELTGLIR